MGTNSHSLLAEGTTRHAHPKCGMRSCGFDTARFGSPSAVRGHTHRKTGVNRLSVGRVSPFQPVIKVNHLASLLSKLLFLYKLVQGNLLEVRLDQVFHPTM